MKAYLTEQALGMGIGMTPEQAQRFEAYHALLTEANKSMNLTRVSQDIRESCDRNYLDSLTLLAHLSGARSLIDVGSGAGFPGLVLKILRPELDLTLLDSLDKRVRFLAQTAELLGLDGLSCLHRRAEEAAELRGQFDAAVSRAVARLDTLSELCLPFVKTGGLFLAMKGPAAAEELDQARRAIRLLGGRVERCEEYPVPGTQLRHCAVLIRKEKDTPPQYPRRWAQIKKQPL
jgi:16S rRNA (guanine527-N7)-methyltransferase